MPNKEINTKNLKVGMTLKNYKTLCDVIGVSPKSGGKNIKEHKEDLKRYFLFKNIEGTKQIKITKIFTDVKEKEDNRKMGNNSKYTEGRKIILTKLVQEKREYRIISKTSLWNELGFINQEYVNRPKELAKWEEQTSIDKEMLIYFDDKTYDTCKKNCERILNNLYNERLIIWENCFKVAVLESNDIKYQYDEVGNIIGIKFNNNDEAKDEVIKKDLVYRIANDEIKTYIIKK